MRGRVLAVAVAISKLGGIAFRITHEVPTAPRKAVRSSNTAADSLNTSHLPKAQWHAIILPAAHRLKPADELPPQDAGRDVKGI